MQHDGLAHISCLLHVIITDSNEKSFNWLLHSLEENQVTIMLVNIFFYVL